ncbi:hypothetical protein [Tenggerimyces flavus]|uniref:DUF3558 domain-containing protein n=1 Tax=Tenggerimyces flavus TaxID=1708749 RepID=A0ABV7YFR6_9ACTN|nr:hypothetical protein [Tenggerimyces flavus]MBM7783434.1 hypothetical protein [Tenggerimyces flavus]
MRTDRWAWTAALVLALAVACSPGEPTPDTTAEPVALDPCDLVSATTVADVVGPALASPWDGLAGDLTTGICSWRLEVDIGDVSDVVRRPTRRLLQIRTTASNDCGEATSTPLPSQNGSTLRFCWNDGTADVTYEAVDDLGGQDVAPDKAQVELILQRVVREVDERRTTAKRLAPDPARTQTATPKPVKNVCDLVAPATLRAARVPRAQDPVDIGVSTKCVWNDGRDRSLALVFTPYGNGQGRPGSAFANVAVEQFAYVWQVEPTKDGAYFGDSLHVDGRAAVGAFQLDVAMTDLDGSDPRLQEFATSVIRDAAKALPQ